MKNTRKNATSIKRILWELIFIFSTVLIFRSAWLLMDIQLGNAGLGVWLVLGIAAAFLSLRELGKFHKF